MPIQSPDRKGRFVSVSNRSTKTDKQLAVSKAVLEVIDKEGLQGVTHSKVSRRAGVSRAWIYEYIGKEKDSLVEFAAEILGTYFTRTKIALPKNKEELRVQFETAVGFLFDSVAENPALIKIYFRFRGTQNPLGEVIDKYEKYWLANAAKSAVEILEVPKDQAPLLAELVLTLRLGFAHRYATSRKPQDVKEHAQKIFELIRQFIA